MVTLSALGNPHIIEPRPQQIKLTSPICCQGRTIGVGGCEIIELDGQFLHNTVRREHIHAILGVIDKATKTGKRRTAQAKGRSHLKTGLYK